MLNRLSFASLLILISCSHGVQAQSFEWLKLIVFESTRSDVEKVIGKPLKYFETSGHYKTEDAEFNVWYSIGRCESGVEGLQYDVKGGLLTQLRFVPLSQLTLASIPLQLETYDRIQVIDHPRQARYYSPDESIVVHVYKEPDGKEYVASISLNPNKEKKKLLCKAK